MSGFTFWQRWLLAVGVVIALFGLFTALAAGTPLFDPFDRQIDWIFWGTAAVGGSVRLFQQWVFGVWGATIAGWGIFVIFLARHPFRKKERWAWNCIALGLAVWFLLDTSISLIHGVYFNAAINTVLFVLTILPLIFTRKDFA
jgi:hypothetical protein